MKKIIYSQLIIVLLLLGSNTLTYSQKTSRSLPNTNTLVKPSRPSTRPPIDIGPVKCLPVSKAERQALIDLFNATSGPKWKNKTNWNSKLGVCQWFGVSVSDGHVIGLKLSDNNLTGKLPASIKNLSYLQWIYMEKNQLSGLIPEEISALKKLKKLHLYKNQLNGQLPLEITSLTELDQLHLYENKLSGFIPANIGNLQKLTHLSLYSNAFIGNIPESVIKLSQLQYLFLHNNKLIGSIPKDIGALGQLKQLMVHNNKLSGTLPEDIGKLSNLNQLYVNGNEFSGVLPKSLEQLRSIQILNFGENNFSGIIPDFTGFRGLHYLRLSSNKFLFRDLESNHEKYLKILKTYSYSPQAKVDEVEVYRLKSGGTLKLTTRLNSKNNRYQWYKNGIAIPKATQRTYTITKGSSKDYGRYHVVATNSVVNRLALIRHDIFVRSAPRNNNFCLSDLKGDVITVADLTPQGANINWYLAQTGGNPLPNSYDIEEVLVDESYTFWYSNGGGTRTAATVYINYNTPEGAEDQYFSGSASPAPTIADIVVDNNGNPVYWYNAPFGGSLLNPNQPLVDGATYYASSCRSLKDIRKCPCLLAVTVHLGVLPPKGDPVQYLCTGAKLGQLVVEAENNNSIQWYTSATGGSPLSSSTLLQNGTTYYAAQINTNGEESFSRLAVTVYLMSTPPPVANSPQTFYIYNSPTVANLLALGDDDIKWFSQAIGGYQYNPQEALVNGQIYYAEQQPGVCPSTRTPVKVILSDDPAPGLLGCDLFKPQVGDSFMINAWVNERAVTASIASQKDFNGSDASQAFTGLLNHLLNRLRSTNKDLHDFPEVYVPEFVGDEQQFNLELILPFLKDLTIEEKILTVYDFQEDFDTYGRTIGFSFYLTASKMYKFQYKTPLIRWIDFNANPNQQLVGPERYPILDNLAELVLEFTNVSVNAAGQFIIQSNFNQQASPSYSQSNVAGTDSGAGVNPQATFYNYHEVAHQQVMNYDYGRIKIEFKAPDGTLMSSQTVELRPSGVIIDNWQKVASVFRIPSNAGQMILSLVNTSDSKMCYFDDLRILPFEGNMKSFVYHPETQRLMAELDENNYATFYEYDKEGGLVRIKKETERGVFTIQETRSGNAKK